ncbi:MAG TPA: response regulator transcription factor [Chloroflexota bacterium]|nr:response regulator transcription factor [Chloroflexota bacterium]
MFSGPTTDKIKVVIVEDEGLYRDLLRVALSQHAHFQVVGAYGDGMLALESMRHLDVDVAILDIDLRSALNGVQLGLLLRQRWPKLGIVLLSNHGDPQFLSSLPSDVLSGWSYLLKKSVSDVNALERAIEGATVGLVVLDPQLAGNMRPRPGGALSRLTPRQQEILGLIAQGFSNAAIAEQLTLAEKSVENQINLLYQQLGIDRGRNALHPRVKAVLAYLQESRFSRVEVAPLHFAHA